VVLFLLGCWSDHLGLTTLGLCGLLLSKAINVKRRKTMRENFIKSYKCKKKQDDERKLHKKKQDEEINEARNKEKILSEKKQEGERKEAKLKKELEEKKREDRRKEAKIKNELEEKKREDRRKEANLKNELEEKKQEDERKERKLRKDLEEKKQEDERKERKLSKDLEEKKKLDEQETSREGLNEKLNNVSVEIKSSPDAVCRWEKCEQVQSQEHIIPSKNIYVSDPDFKGYYQVCCRTNCKVSYHKSCWLSVKGENSDKFKLAKCPTEKDFLGKTCFTPDCGDIIVNIEIIDDSGEIRTIKDVKMMEQLLVDERKRREESQIKRKRKNDEERFKIYEKQIKKKSEKIQSKKNSPFSLTSVSPNPISSTPSVSFARNVSRVPQVVTRPFPTPGNSEARFSVPAPPVLPKVFPRPGITSQDSFARPTSRSTFSPTSNPVPQLEVTQASQAGSNYPSTEATSTGATATFHTSSRPTSTGAIPKTYQPGAETGKQYDNLVANLKTDQPRAETGKQYDNLVAQLQKDHPSLGQDRARAYVMELRQFNGGKLSGMKRQDILNKVASFIKRDMGSVDGASFMRKDKAIVDVVADEEDNDCSICLEDMLDSDSLYLNPCRHRYHTVCINQWLDSPGGAGSTCPMCRNYIVKEQDFPSLGKSFRRF